MTKQEYFKMIRKINRGLRKEGAMWVQTYSEPRKKVSYRTKLYHICYRADGKVFDSLAAARYVMEKSNGLLQAKRFVGKSLYGCPTTNLVITPTNKLNCFLM